MPDFGDIEKEAQDRTQEVDEGIEKTDQLADKETGGRDKGLIDKGASEAEKELGGQQTPADPSTGQSPAQ
jgi:hypothetical protein